MRQLCDAFENWPIEGFVAFLEDGFKSLEFCQFGGRQTPRILDFDKRLKSIARGIVLVVEYI